MDPIDPNMFNDNIVPDEDFLLASGIKPGPPPPSYARRAWTWLVALFWQYFAVITVAVGVYQETIMSSAQVFYTFIVEQVFTPLGISVLANVTNTASFIFSVLSEISPIFSGMVFLACIPVAYFIYMAGKAAILAQRGFQAANNMVEKGNRIRAIFVQVSACVGSLLFLRFVFSLYNRYHVQRGFEAGKPSLLKKAAAMTTFIAAAESIYHEVFVTQGAPDFRAALGTLTVSRAIGSFSEFFVKLFSADDEKPQKLPQSVDFAPPVNLDFQMKDQPRCVFGRPCTHCRKFVSVNMDVSRRVTPINMEHLNQVCNCQVKLTDRTKVPQCFCGTTKESLVYKPVHSNASFECFTFKKRDVGEIYNCAKDWLSDKWEQFMEIPDETIASFITFMIGVVLVLGFIKYPSSLKDFLLTKSSDARAYFSSILGFESVGVKYGFESHVDKYDNYHDDRQRIKLDNWKKEKDVSPFDFWNEPADPETFPDFYRDNRVDWESTLASRISILEAKLKLVRAEKAKAQKVTQPKVAAQLPAPAVIQAPVPVVVQAPAPVAQPAPAVESVNKCSKNCPGMKVVIDGGVRFLQCQCKFQSPVQVPNIAKNVGAPATKSKARRGKKTAGTEAKMPNAFPLHITPSAPGAHLCERGLTVSSNAGEIGSCFATSVKGKQVIIFNHHFLDSGDITVRVGDKNLFLKEHARFRNTDISVFFLDDTKLAVKNLVKLNTLDSIPQKVYLCTREGDSLIVSPGGKCVAMQDISGSFKHLTSDYHSIPGYCGGRLTTDMQTVVGLHYHSNGEGRGNNFLPFTSEFHDWVEAIVMNQG
jgi:hypothetical protein